MLNININKEKKYFIFNINSSSVSGALVYFDQEKNKPKIEYSVISEIQILKKTSAISFKENTTKSLREVSAKLENYIKISESIFNIEKVLIFVAPPWYRKDINILVDERIEPFLITEKYLEEMLGEGGKIRDNEELINAEILSVKANDYNVLLAELFDKEVYKVEISLFDSYMKEKDKNFFKSIIEEHFSFLEIKFYPFLPVFLDQIKKIYNINDDYAFLDFTGEVMEFGIYRDNQLKAFFSVESGKNKIIRTIFERGLAKNFAEAKYILTSYIRNELEQKNSIKVAEIITDELDYINDKIEKELLKNKIDLIPSKVFILSFGEMNKLIEELNVFKKTYFLGKSYLKLIVESNDESDFDNFIALEADFIYSR